MGTRIFLFEARRLALSAGCGMAWGAVTSQWQQALFVFLVVLLLLWGWQLARVYHWFSHPEEFPPIGGPGMQGILHDVYVLRSRAMQATSSSQRSQPYLKESLASMREAALIINSSQRLIVVQRGGGVFIGYPVCHGGRTAAH